MSKTNNQPTNGAAGGGSNGSGIMDAVKEEPMDAGYEVTHPQLPNLHGPTGGIAFGNGSGGMVKNEPIANEYEDADQQVSSTTGMAEACLRSNGSSAMVRMKNEPVDSEHEVNNPEVSSTNDMAGANLWNNGSGARVKEEPIDTEETAPQPANMNIRTRTVGTDIVSEGFGEMAENKFEVQRNMVNPLLEGNVSHHQEERGRSGKRRHEQSRQRRDESQSRSRGSPRPKRNHRNWSDESRRGEERRMVSRSSRSDRSNSYDRRYRRYEPNSNFRRNYEHLLGPNGNFMKTASYANGASKWDNERKIEAERRRAAEYYAERRRKYMPESYGQGFKDWETGKNRRNKKNESRQTEEKHSNRRRDERKDKKEKGSRKSTQEQQNPHVAIKQVNMGKNGGPENRERCQEMDVAQATSVPLPPVVSVEEEQRETVEMLPANRLGRSKKRYDGPLSRGRPRSRTFQEWTPQATFDDVDSSKKPQKNQAPHEFAPHAKMIEEQWTSQAVLDTMDSPLSPDANQMEEEKEEDKFIPMSSPVPRHLVTFEDDEEDTNNYGICKSLLQNVLADIEDEPRLNIASVLSSEELVQYQIILKLHMEYEKKEFIDETLFQLFTRKEGTPIISIRSLTKFINQPGFQIQAWRTLKYRVEERMKFFPYVCYMWVTETNISSSLHDKLAKLVPSIDPEMTDEAMIDWYNVVQVLPSVFDCRGLAGEVYSRVKRYFEFSNPAVSNE